MQRTYQERCNAVNPSLSHVSMATEPSSSSILARSPANAASLSFCPSSADIVLLYKADVSFSNTRSSHVDAARKDAAAAPRRSEGRIRRCPLLSKIRLSESLENTAQISAPAYYSLFAAGVIQLSVKSSRQTSP